MENNRPLFSISTPCWNSVDTIERTLKSVLAQEFKDYEYNIVDGGSTDGTLDIIKKYEPLFEGRMHWKSEPDKGLYDAFNKGIERSKGIYCWNVNADDFIEPDALQKIADFINTLTIGELPVVSGALHFVSAADNIILYDLKSNKHLLQRSFEIDCMGVPHPATLVPKDIYDKYGVFDTYYKIIGDADWFHRVYAAGVKFEFIDAVITNMSDGGASNQYVYLKELRDRKYYLKKFYPNYLDRMEKLVRWTLSFFYNKFLHK